MGMNRELIPIQLDGETVVYGVVRIIEGEEEVAFDALSFDGFTDSIQKLTVKLASVFDSVKPDKATLAFGVELAVQNGALTALFGSAKTSGGLKIQLEWSRRDERSDLPKNEQLANATN